MGSVHQLILKEGVEGARAGSLDPRANVCCGSGGNHLAEEGSRLGITTRGSLSIAAAEKHREHLWRDGTTNNLLVKSGRTGEGGWIGGRVSRRLIYFTCRQRPFVAATPKWSLGGPCMLGSTRLASPEEDEFTS